MSHYAYASFRLSRLAFKIKQDQQLDFDVHRDELLSVMTNQLLIVIRVNVHPSKIDEDHHFKRVIQ